VALVAVLAALVALVAPTSGERMNPLPARRSHGCSRAMTTMAIPTVTAPMMIISTVTKNRSIDRD
jgi:hypothetical protein